MESVMKNKETEWELLSALCMPTWKTAYLELLVAKRFRLQNYISQYYTFSVWLFLGYFKYILIIIISKHFWTDSAADIFFLKTAVNIFR